MVRLDESLDSGHARPSFILSSRFADTNGKTRCSANSSNIVDVIWYLLLQPSKRNTLKALKSHSR